MGEVDEFLPQKKERRKGYTVSTRQDGTNVVIVDHKRITPAEKLEVEMLVKANYEIKSKRADISKTDMIRYVKNNYDAEEQAVLQKELEKINTTDENDIKVTFMTVKSWFKNRYKYYPKGKDYKYSDAEKQARYERTFEAHQKELKAERNKKNTAQDTNTENKNK